MHHKIDIFRSAKLLIDQFGADAALEANIRADEMLINGDLNGEAVWLAVEKAIKTLQSDVPTGTIH